MRRVLLVTRSFPPLLDVGAQRAFRFASFLADWGWHASVLTNRIPDGFAMESELSLERIHVVRRYHPTWWPQAHLSYSSSRAPVEVVRPEEAHVRSLLAVFGNSAIALPTAYRIAELARTVRADVIWATSGPAATLVHGVIAGWLTNLPVCLDLRDPWSLNHTQADRPAWRRVLERRLEAMIFAAAQCIVFSCLDAEHSYRRQYPRFAARMSTVPTGYDPRVRIPVAPKASAVTLVHYGNCFGSRRLETVLHAIARLRGDRSWPAGGIHLLNLGRIHREDLELARALGIASQLEAREAIGPKAAAYILGGADALVLIGYAGERVHVPNKTYDYLRHRAPILCIAAEPSELADIVRTTGRGIVIGPKDVEAAARAIAGVVAIRAAELPVPSPHLEAIEYYDSRVSARRLATIFDSIADGVHAG